MRRSGRPDRAIACHVRRVVPLFALRLRHPQRAAYVRGHARACGEQRWPTSVDPPGEGWECGRCRITTPEERQRRQEAARQAQVTREIRAAMRRVNEQELEEPEPEPSADDRQPPLFS